MTSFLHVEILRGTRENGRREWQDLWISKDVCHPGSRNISPCFPPVQVHGPQYLHRDFPCKGNTLYFRRFSCQNGAHYLTEAVWERKMCDPASEWVAYSLSCCHPPSLDASTVICALSMPSAKSAASMFKKKIFFHSDFAYCFEILINTLSMRMCCVRADVCVCVRAGVCGMFLLCVQTAMSLHKHFPAKKPYCYWGAMSVFLQVRTTSLLRISHWWIVLIKFIWNESCVFVSKGKSHWKNNCG